MRTAGLVVAAGRGTRLGGAIPKQYLALRPAPAAAPRDGTTAGTSTGTAAGAAAETVLACAVRALLAHPGIEAVRVVIAAGDEAACAAALAPLAGDPRLLPPVAGGADRAASVRAGLESLVDLAPARVLVHDGARPFLTAAVTGRVLAALDDAPAACPALPVVDALWRGEATGDGRRAAAPVPRENLWRAQTPQGFRFDAILAAHRANRADAADDVAVARAAGLAVALVDGDEANYKITTAADLDRARREIERNVMDVRTGNGFDVHAFGPGDHVTLCGVRLPFDRGLVGHSDADVGMHAVTDAILGALCEGDIGRWFPPSDPQWKGAASGIFLRAAASRAAEAGFAITHLDCTLICEAPKVGPHAAAMRAALAAAAELDPARISVKATTSERLGFTGRGEGIAALATATLVRQMETPA